MLMPDLQEIRERSARQDGVADSTVKQLLAYIAELDALWTSEENRAKYWKERCGDMELRITDLEAGIKTLCRCDEMPEGPYRCAACNLLKPTT